MTTARVRPINGLPLAGQLDGTEIIPAVQGGAAVSVTADKLAARAALLVAPGNATKESVGLGSVDNLSAAQLAAPGNAVGNRLRDIDYLTTGVPQIKAYGAPVGSGWSASFAAVEAASPNRVLLPPGTYSTGRNAFALTAPYSGPGSATMLSTGGDYLPADFSWILTRPFTGTGSGYNRFFSADGKYSERDYRIIGTGLRVGLTEPYYAPELSKRFSIYDTRAGSSGFVSQLASATAAGATQVPLVSADGLSVGQVVAFNTSGGPLNAATGQVTITAISGNTITVSPALSVAHTTQDYVTNGLRTMQSRGHFELNHSGGGDAYINLFRVNIAGAPLAGTKHVFQTKTGGFDGGDINFSANGGYSTVREVAINDNGFDVAVAAEVRSFDRTNDTGARGAFWVGNIYKSEGTKAANSSHVVAGKWNNALDTVRADFSSFGNTAINMAQGQGITFDSTSDPSELYSIWGKILGKTWFGMEYGEVRTKVAPTGTQVIATAISPDGQLRQVRKPMVTAEATAPITLNNTYQTLKLVSVYDAMGDYSATTGRFVCRVAGRYRVSFRVTMAGSTASNTAALASVFKNGSSASVNGSWMAIAFEGPFRTASAETIIYCNASDYLEIKAVDGDAAGGILHGGPANGFTVEYLG